MFGRAKTDLSAFYIDKKLLRKIIEEQEKLMGIVHDPTATGEKSQAMMRALGIQDEDNIGSCGIIAAREE